MKELSLKVAVYRVGVANPSELNTSPSCILILQAKDNKETRRRRVEAILSKMSLICLLQTNPLQSFH